MATVNPQKETRFNEDMYPVWKRSFDPKMRHDLVDQDLFAGKSVSGLLVLLVSFGLVLGILAVILATGY